jgi:hypothetical protein
MSNKHQYSDVYTAVDQRDEPRSVKDSKSTKTDVPFDMKVIDVYTTSDIHTLRQRIDENVDIAMRFD